MLLRSQKVIAAVLLLLVAATLMGAPWVGSHSLDSSVLSKPGSSDLDAIIFWQIRVPRVLLSFLAGVGLSLGGVVFQAMFRNPLATPFTLGVAGGASFGVALWVHLGISFSLLGVSGVSLAALLGAMLSIVLLYGIAKASGKLSPMTMLLGGVAISFFFSSLIMLLQYLMDAGNSFRVIHWLMGDMGRADADSVLQVFPFVGSGALIAMVLRRELNLLTVSDDLAASRGVNVEQVRVVLFFAVSLMVAGIITVCGPIGFVGIMAPHICRLIVGANHRILVPCAALFGGVFLTLCDTVARSVTDSAEIPVGVVTALLGGPFFLWLLFRNGERRQL
ncbi:iron ABC transporter permease [Verrucomicrobiaceae bacterium N1E253]|uniref:Iron ABC transporter permease n=1 Tax=Oceaniferula marina TaxID=2748318 RepID=A0A851GIU5_9BACT|nr:iron ABC transporter permease [Oceaniferula marina]NWK56882.1 iron ABC transporter permease [Oceaniferula marina]